MPPDQGKMREGWNRATAAMELSTEDVENVLRPVLPNVKVVEVTPTSGGLANTNLKIRVAGDEQALLLRFFVRDPGAVGKEFRLLNLVKERAATPVCRHFAVDNPVTGHPYILMQWVDGERLERVVCSLGPDETKHLGESLGKALAGIHSFEFDKAGFFGENLQIAAPMEMSGAGLLAYTIACLTNPLVEQRLDHDFVKRTIRFVDRENVLLDEWAGNPCLTHCDFNSSNILVNATAGFWEVAAVLDWEFAISGTPFFDFGNLLRAPVGEIPGMEEAVANGYKNAGGKLPPQWRRMSKLTDLTAWFEFLTRESAGPQLISDARAQIARTMDEW